jgi:hypothetical protein
LIYFHLFIDKFALTQIPTYLLVVSMNLTIPIKERKLIHKEPSYSTLVREGATILIKLGKVKEVG